MWRAQRQNLGIAGLRRVLYALLVSGVACGDDGPGEAQVDGLRFVAQPAAIGAGVPMTVTVELVSSGGTRVTTATDQVTLSVSGGAVLGGTTTVAAVAGVATFTGLTVNSLGQNLQLTASTGDISATSTTFSVVAGPPTAQQSVMTVPANVVANANATLTFTFKDALNNPVSNAPVSFSSNLAGTTFTPASGATDASGSFTTVFRSSNSGSASITVSVGGTSVTFATAIVVAAGASALRFVTPPASSIVAGQPFSISVEVLDNNGQRLTTATNQITLALSAGTLVGTGVGNAVAGVATFNSLSINGVATGLAMTALSGTLSVQSGLFNVTAGVPTLAQSTLTLSQALSNGTASTATFAFKDAASNPIQNAAVSIASSIAGTTLVPATGTTNATGVFTSVITPGAIGAGTITATVGGTQLVFNVTALGPCVVGAITLDTPLSATLAASSGCLLNNHPASTNRFTIPAGNATVVALSGTGVSANFFPELVLTADPPGTTGTLFFGQPTPPVALRGPVEWLLPAGTYRATISSSNGGGGDFTLLAANLGTGGIGCVPTRPAQLGSGRLLLGVNATYVGQALASTDCIDSGGPYFIDVFTLFDSRPCSVTITAAFPIYFDMESDTQLLANVVDGPTTGTISLPACRTASSAAHLVVSSATGNTSVSGSYTLTVAFTGTSGPAQASELRVMSDAMRNGGLPVTQMGRAFARGRRR